MTLPYPAPPPSYDESLHLGREALAPTPKPAPHGEHGGPDLGFPIPPPARPTAVRSLAVGLVVMATLGALFAVRWATIRRAQAALTAESAERGVALPRIQLLSPTVISSDKALTLPGSVQPLEGPSCTRGLVATCTSGT